jgi:hypothetical protein
MGAGMTRIFAGYNPRDLQKTLKLVEADIAKRKEKKKGIPAHIQSFASMLRRQLAEEKEACNSE